MTVQEAIDFLQSLPNGNFKVTKLVVGFDVEQPDEPVEEPERKSHEA